MSCHFFREEPGRLVGLSYDTFALARLSAVLGITTTSRAKAFLRTAVVQLTSTLACPHCGRRTPETMPTDACQFFYECIGCGVLLRPKPGDCCVFCSYGDVLCPPVQDAKGSTSVPFCCGCGLFTDSFGGTAVRFGENSLSIDHKARGPSGCVTAPAP